MNDTGNQDPLYTELLACIDALRNASHAETHAGIMGMLMQKHPRSQTQIDVDAKICAILRDPQIYFATVAWFLQHHVQYGGGIYGTCTLDTHPYIQALLENPLFWCFLDGNEDGYVAEEKGEECYQLLKNATLIALIALVLQSTNAKNQWQKWQRHRLSHIKDSLQRIIKKRKAARQPLIWHGNTASYSLESLTDALPEALTGFL